MNFYQNRNLIYKGQSPDIGNLWLGDYQSARKKRDLKNDGINAVVTAGLGMKVSYTTDFKHKLLALYDHPSENIYRFFEASYQFLDEALKNGNVLIHCYAGVSRSTTILAAYLMRKNQWSLKETLALIKKQRPFIRPNQGFSSQLRKFQAQLNGTNLNSTNLTKSMIPGRQKELISKIRVQSRKSHIRGQSSANYAKKEEQPMKQRSVVKRSVNQILQIRSKTLQKAKKY